MDEFELIARYFSGHDASASLGVGDDAAIVDLEPGELLAVAVDTLVAGVHFPEDSDAADVGYRALAVNLSDLAAMGARPRWMTLALTLPQGDPAWLAGFAEGLLGLAGETGVDLIGGDTTRGPLTVSVQLLGTLADGRRLLRSAARPGDAVWVSGTLGDAAGWLALTTNGPARERLRQRFARPEPRIALGLALAETAHAGDGGSRTAAASAAPRASTAPATVAAPAAPAASTAPVASAVPAAPAAIDVSDGLLADLGHICEASGVGAVIDVGALPLSDALVQAAGLEKARELALTGGDDYELCFTLAPDAAAPETGVGVTRIGEMTAGAGVRCVLEGRPYTPPRAGYRHFDAAGG